MIISNIKLPVEHNDSDLYSEVKERCGLKAFQYRITKKSTDARHGNLNFVYSVEVIDKTEHFENKRLSVSKANLSERPVVIGSGPAGLFCAYFLAKSGAEPIIFERGGDIDERCKVTSEFFCNRTLNENTNIQFGEGGAGTFSDGKLNTGISNSLCKEVLNIFVDFGAPEEILYLSKPHIGTDNLRNVIKNIRNEIIKLGGEFHFNTRVTDIKENNSKIKSIIADKEYITNHVVFAIGHSARDTFEMLYRHKTDMIQKAFSIGARIEHKRKDVDFAQYGKYAETKSLGAADYKLSYHAKDGRGVYTFCMCPGGEVIGATSEKNCVVTNGMSYYKRNSENSNSAFLVSVSPKDFNSDSPLGGIEYQRKIEMKAFEFGGDNYSAPCQMLGDFVKKQKSTYFGNVKPSYKPGVTSADLWNVLPEYICNSMIESLDAFNDKLNCFNKYDSILTGAETRSSSPVRILRDESFQSNITGLYPCGEGAGYAGGIMSAAVDGIKIALKIIEEGK